MARGDETLEHVLKGGAGRKKGDGGTRCAPDGGGRAAADASKTRSHAHEDRWVAARAVGAGPGVLGAEKPGAVPLPANNSIVGSAQNDKIFGYEGNDTLNGGLGADTLVGGVGNDTYFVDNVSDIVTEDANAGTDTVFSSIGHALGANIENLQLLGTASVNGVGNALDNVIQGNAGNNLIGGNEGNDTLGGGDGNDQLVGGPGNDYLQGDKGNDTLVGNDGIDRLFGGAGSDLLAGQAGNDELTGGSEADQFYFNLGGGQDIIWDFQDGIDKITLGKDIKNISVFVSNGSAALDLYDAASSTPHTYVLLQGIQASQIDNSDFLWA